MSTYNIPFLISKRKSPYKFIQSLQLCHFSMRFMYTLVLNSRGKRAISVRATEVLLYVRCPLAGVCAVIRLKLVRYCDRFIQVNKLYGKLSS